MLHTALIVHWMPKKWQPFDAIGAYIVRFLHFPLIAFTISLVYTFTLSPHFYYRLFRSQVVIAFFFSRCCCLLYAHHSLFNSNAGIHSQFELRKLKMPLENRTIQFLFPVSFNGCAKIKKSKRKKKQRSVELGIVSNSRFQLVKVIYCAVCSCCTSISRCTFACRCTLLHADAHFNIKK